MECRESLCRRDRNSYYEFDIESIEHYLFKQPSFIFDNLQVNGNFFEKLRPPNGLMFIRLAFNWKSRILKAYRN